MAAAAPSVAPRRSALAFIYVTALLAVGSIGLLRASPVLFGLAGVALFNNLGHDVNPHVFGFYAMDRYGFEEEQVGRTLMAVGIGGVLVSGVLVGPIVRRLGERRALLLGLASRTLGFGLQGWAPVAFWFWAGIPLINLWSLYGPAMQGLMVPRVGASEQGQLQGALQGLRGLCALATPLLYTQAFLRGSAVTAGAPYWLAAGLVGAALLLALRAAAPVPAAKLPEVR